MNQRSKIAVIGYGVEGKAMLKWLTAHGYSNVTVCDRRVRLGEKLPSGVSAQLGEHYLDGLSEFEVIFRSPGVPHHDPSIVEASVLGVEVTSPTQFFLDHCPCIVIGVTGTKGKGTTATLIYEILKAGFAGGKAAFGGSRGAGTGAAGTAGAVLLGGNIGNPPIEFLDEVCGRDVVVLELSCFQLGDLKKSPAVAVFLNTTVDHLDYYPDVGEYMRAKELILAHQDADDLAVLNRDYEYVKYYQPLVKGRLAFVSPKGKAVKNGAWVEDGWIKYAGDGGAAGGAVKGTGGTAKPSKPERIMRVADVALIGSHNLENVCPAVVVGREFGVSAKVIDRVVRAFKGLPHRLEFVRKVDGVSYYNDSFSTNPFTSMAAVDSFSVPTVLIAGGSDKELDYLEWARKILTKASLEAVVLIGATTEKMEKAIVKAKGRLERGEATGEATPTEVVKCKSLKEAVAAAKARAKKGGVVVMSSAAASFDQFKDYKDRGEKFRELVRGL